MDPATAFLVRKDKKALDKRLKKGETTRIVVQARHHDHVGLLAATGRRVLFVYKQGLRHRHLEVLGTDVGRLTERKVGHGEVRMQCKDGRDLTFTMLQRGSASAFCETLRPTPPVRTGSSVQTRKGGPMVFTPKAKAAPSAQTKPHPRGRAHDPLAASKQQKLARLEELHKKGRIGKAEYEWQKDALS